MLKTVAVILVGAALFSGCATPVGVPTTPTDATITALIDKEIERLLVGGDPYGEGASDAERSAATPLQPGQTLLQWLRQHGADTNLYYSLPERDKNRLSNLREGTELALISQGDEVVGFAVKRTGQWWLAHQELSSYRLVAEHDDTQEVLRVFDIPIVGGSLERTLAVSSLSSALKAEIEPVLSRGFPASNFPERGMIRLRLSYTQINGVDLGTPVLASAALSSDQAPRFIVRYPPPGEGGAVYYDGEGKRLESLWISEPLMGEFRITSEFNPHRRHPITGRVRPHNGRDFAAQPRTPVVAATDGEVIHAGWKGSWGKLVVLRHANGVETRYAHLSSIKSLSPGDVVTKGQQIGGVGTTGLSTGPHLHFEVYQHGLAVNPAGFDPNNASASTISSRDVQDHLAQYRVFEQASLAKREEGAQTYLHASIEGLTGQGGPDEDDTPWYSVEPVMRAE